MGYAQRIDWSTVHFDGETWENHGRRLVEEACSHHPKGDKDENLVRYQGWCEKCDVSEDSEQPMMNFIYPLETEPSEEEILEVVRQTCCTVVENLETGEYFLTLCGGGMDLSQDIALAYLLAEQRIPFDLAHNVCTQYGLSKSGEKWLKVMDGCKDSLETAKGWADQAIERIDREVEEYKAKQKKDNKKVAVVV